MTERANKYANNSFFMDWYDIRLPLRAQKTGYYSF